MHPLKTKVYSQTTDTQIKHVTLSEAVLLRVEHGCKQVNDQTALTGSFVFMQPDYPFSIRNSPDPVHGFKAQAFIFTPGAFDPAPQAPALPVSIVKQHSDLGESFTRLWHALNAKDFPEAVLEARISEMQGWMTHLNLHPTPVHTLSGKVRRLIMTDPAHAWRSAEIASALATGEATLRRALAKEGTTFSALLRETRLQIALEQLQTTRTGLSEIAFSTGFSSQAHFTDVFRKRFDFPPGRLRRSALHAETKQNTAAHS